MDLTLKKCDLQGDGIPKEEAATFRFETKPDAVQILSSFDPLAIPTSKQALRRSHILLQTRITSQRNGHLPFFLMTKLLADPITPVYLAGMEVEDERFHFQSSIFKYGSCEKVH